MVQYLSMNTQPRVGSISALGKRVGPVIERSLVRNPNWKLTIFWAPSPSIGGQDSLVDKALDYRPKGTGFDPRLDHKRRSTWATNSFSMWDKDLLIVDHLINCIYCTLYNTFSITRSMYIYIYLWIVSHSCVMYLPVCHMSVFVRKVERHNPSIRSF
jgi:hypothetical protein